MLKHLTRQKAPQQQKCQAFTSGTFQYVIEQLCSLSFPLLIGTLNYFDIFEVVATHKSWKEQKVSTLHQYMTRRQGHLSGAMKVNQKAKSVGGYGAWSQVSFTLKECNYIEQDTLVYGYQTITLTPQILLYKLRNAKPMPSFYHYYRV